jgi:cytochrome c-type biogenesis protein CcmH/NrfG
MAWFRATNPDARFRDGAQAVALARHAAELTPEDPDTLDALAAAYAEAGRFAEAVETARKALDLAARQSNSALAEGIRSKIRLYEAEMPFHELPQSSPDKK